MEVGVVRALGKMSEGSFSRRKLALHRFVRAGGLIVREDRKCNKWRFVSVSVR